MEPSQVFGEVEECHSCESGWTMYIGDDADDHNTSDAGDDENDDHNVKKVGKKYGREDDSDDSMASDASSGPSYQGMHRYKHEDGYKHDDNDDEDHDGHYGLKMKDEKVEKKRSDRRKRNEKQEEIMFIPRGRNVSTQSGSRVSKSFWMGKRK